MSMCNILVSCFVGYATSVLWDILQMVISHNSGTLTAQMRQVVHFSHALFWVMQIENYVVNWWLVAFSKIIQFYMFCVFLIC